MTDPQNPVPPPEGGSVPPPPASPPESAPPSAYAAAPPAYGAAPSYGAAPAYGQQPYPSAPPPQYGAPASPAIPGRTLGIVAFILSFFMQLVSLILGIVALVQSRKAGHKNGWAVAAIIISSVLLVLGVIFAIVFFVAILPQLADTAEQIFRQCQELGPGVHEIGGLPVDCGDVLDR